MITAIENAIVDRLKSGLGRMVQEVKSYGGELDSEHWAKAIGRVPAIWVAYGGAKVRTKNTAHARYEQSATFAVMCATRSLRSEQASRQGGAGVQEIGSNALVQAVLRLLAGQQLGGRLNSQGLIPNDIRIILKNAYIAAGALSVVSIEFNAIWSFWGLEDGHFPEPTSDKDDPDYIFNLYGAQQSAQYSDFKRMTSLILDNKKNAQIEANLNMRDEYES